MKREERWKDVNRLKEEAAQWKEKQEVEGGDGNMMEGC